MIKHFSTLIQVKKSLAWWLRYKNNLYITILKKKNKNLKSCKSVSEFLTIQELEKSMKLLIKHIQRECFSDEKKQLKTDKYVKSSSKLS